MITQIKTLANSRRREHLREMRLMQAENRMLRKLIKIREPEAFIITHTYPPVERRTLELAVYPTHL